MRTGNTSDSSPDAIADRLGKLEAQMQWMRLAQTCFVVVLLFLFFAWLIPPLQLPLFLVLFCIIVIGLVVGLIRSMQLLLEYLFDRAAKDDSTDARGSHSR